MSKFPRIFLAVPLVALAVVGGIVVPDSASADGTLAEYKWSSDEGFVEFSPGGFWLESRTDHSKLVFQADGNLVLYADGGRAVWQSRTYGQRAAKVSFQSDGNVVVYRADNTSIWSSGVVRSVPSGYWHLDLVGTAAAPIVDQHNRLTGATTFWRIP